MLDLKSIRQALTLDEHLRAAAARPESAGVARRSAL